MYILAVIILLSALVISPKFIVILFIVVVVMAFVVLLTVFYNLRRTSSGKLLSSTTSLIEGSLKEGPSLLGTVSADVEPTPITVTSIDDELLGRVLASIEAHMSDSSYTVVELSTDVGLTRGHLYKRLLTLTGRSPLELIHQVRLKRGKSLLDQGRTNISEVAYTVGLSAKSFAHHFKQTYGLTPSDYLRNVKAQTHTIGLSN